MPPWMQAVPLPHPQAHAVQRSCSTWLVLQVGSLASPLQYRADMGHVVTPLPGVLLTCMLAYTPTPAMAWQHCRQSHLLLCTGVTR